jgi:hypothetical protein
MNKKNKKKVDYVTFDSDQKLRNYKKMFMSEINLD